MVETENFESLGAHPFMQFGSLFFNAVAAIFPFGVQVRTGVKKNTEYYSSLQHLQEDFG